MANPNPVTSSYSSFGELLGWGTFSKVYKGKKEDTGSPRVIKISRAKDAAFRNVRQEAIFMDKIKGVPHAAEMLAHFNSTIGKAKRHVIVFDNLSRHSPSMTIQDWIRKAGSFSFKRTVSCTAQFLECLIELKNREITHNDLSARNAICNKEANDLTVIDFGSAKEIKDLKNCNHLTALNNRAPEMLLEKTSKATFASDMWALGVNVYYMYTGRFPFDFEDEFAAIKSIVSSLGMPPEAYHNDISKDASKFLSSLKGLPKMPFQYHWKEIIKRAGAKKGDSKEQIALVIDFLNRIFCYENRMTAEEALQHPLLASDIRIEIDSERVDPLTRNATVLEIQNKRVPLKHHCFHLTKEKTDKYAYRILKQIAPSSYQVRSTGIQKFPDRDQMWVFSNQPETPPSETKEALPSTKSQPASNQ